MSISSESRVWLMTGCSSGFGLSLVEALLATEDRVVATLRRPSVLDHLTSKHPPEKLLVLALDVTIPSQVEDVFMSVKKQFGRLDVVVNNAGYGILGEIEATSDEEAREQIEVLFWGSVTVCRQAVKFFREVNSPGVGGLIMNISSSGGYNANPALGFYNAGKFALEGFTEALAAEMLPDWNIKAVIIEPGGFRTEWAKGSMVRLPPHPAYTNPSAPSSYMRSLLGESFVPRGDPAKAAQAMIAVSKLPAPPMRIQLGSDCLQIVKMKAQLVLKDLETWEHLARSTDADGGDTAELLKKIEKAVPKA